MSCASSVPVQNAQNLQVLSLEGRVFRTEQSTKTLSSDVGDIKEKLANVRELANVLNDKLSNSLAAVEQRNLLVEELLNKHFTDNLNVMREAVSHDLVELKDVLEARTTFLKDHVESLSDWRKEASETLADLDQDLAGMHKYLAESHNRRSLSSLCIAVASATWASVVAASWIYVLHK